MSLGPGQTADPIALSIIIPAFNEAQRLAPTLRAIAAWSSGDNLAIEIIVVDDGSIDATTSVAWHEPSTRGLLRVLRLPKNRGKGAAVAAGVMAARSDLVLMYDADAAVPIDEVPKLIAALDAGADIAVGSRSHAESEVLAERTRARVLMSWAFNALVRTAVAVSVQDAMCGFKLFRRSDALTLFKDLQVARFTFDIEILSRATQHGLRVAEVPVIWRHDPRSSVRPVRDAFRAVRDVAYVVLSRGAHRN